MSEPTTPESPIDAEPADAIEFDATTTFADFIEFQRLTQRQRRRIALVLTLAMAIGYVLFNVVFLFGSIRDTPWFLWAFAVLIALFPLAQRWMVRAAWHKVFRRTPTLGSRRRVRLADDRIEEALEVSGAWVLWIGFTHLRETPRQFLLQRGPYLAQMLPKRDIEAALGPDGVGRVRAFIEARVTAGDAMRPGFEVSPAPAAL